MAQQPVHTLIVDDSPRSRAGLRALLATCPQVDVVAEAVDGDEAIQQVATCHPDVVLMDARMPGMDGLAATQHIKQRWPHVRVVMLTLYADYRMEALAAGVAAFLVKGCSAEELLQALLADEGGDL